MVEKELERPAPFTKIKYLGTNLVKHMKDLYNEKYIQNFMERDRTPEIGKKNFPY